MANRRGRSEDAEQEDRKRITGERLKQLLNVFQYILPYRGYFIGGLVFLAEPITWAFILPAFVVLGGVAVSVIPRQNATGSKGS